MKLIFILLHQNNGYFEIFRLWLSFFMNKRGAKSRPTAGFLNQSLEHMNQMHRQTADSVY